MQDFLALIAAESAQPISGCYQCKKCSGGCPVASYAEFKPHQVVRMVQLGRQEQLLASPGIWFCIGCKICQTRCPNGIDVSAILDALKARAILREDVHEQGLPIFHDCVLGSIKRHGRLFELGMVAGYKIRSKRWTEDGELGAKMFFKGKLALLPHRCSKRSQIREIFKLEEGVRPELKGGTGDG